MTDDVFGGIEEESQFIIPNFIKIGGVNGSDDLIFAAVLTVRQVSHISLAVVCAASSCA